jgi:hypothetical protein
MELLALNGPRIDPQPLEMTQLARNGNWDYRHLIKAIERGEFGAILIMDKLPAVEALSDIPIIFWIGCNKGAASSCLCARLERRTSRHMQGAHHLCGTVGALGLAGGSVRLERPGGGVGGVVLTEPAPVLAVRAVHLDDLYTSSAQEAGQSHAEAAAAFDAGALQRSELLHPSHQRGVAGLCRRHALVTEAPTVAVEGYRNVYVGMCSMPRMTSVSWSLWMGRKSIAPSSHSRNRLFLCALTSRDGGQYCDETWRGQVPIRSHPAPTGGATASLQTGRRIR